MPLQWSREARGNAFTDIQTGLFHKKKIKCIILTGVQARILIGLMQFKQVKEKEAQTFTKSKLTFQHKHTA